MKLLLFFSLLKNVKQWSNAPQVPQNSPNQWKRRDLCPACYNVIHYQHCRIQTFPSSAFHNHLLLSSWSSWMHRHRSASSSQCHCVQAVACIAFILILASFSLVPNVCRSIWQWIDGSSNGFVPDFALSRTCSLQSFTILLSAAFSVVWA